VGKIHCVRKKGRFKTNLCLTKQGSVDGVNLEESEKEKERKMEQSTKKDSPCVKERK